jgi:hypothetical protein
MEGYLDASLRLGGLWRSGVHDGLAPAVELRIVWRMLEDALATVPYAASLKTAPSRRRRAAGTAGEDQAGAEMPILRTPALAIRGMLEETTSDSWALAAWRAP